MLVHLSHAPSPLRHRIDESSPAHVTGAVPPGSGRRNQQKSKLMTEELGLRIQIVSLCVNDQDNALAFYTDVLGFEKKTDFRGQYRWLTVVSPQAPEGPELQLAPKSAHPTAGTYQEALYQQGQPAMMFYVDDVQAEYERLKKADVTFTVAPTKTTGSIIATLDDTCGNLIQLTQLTW
jgi:predicted enzyme related to lactoylglutathione lyase